MCIIEWQYIFLILWIISMLASLANILWPIEKIIGLLSRPLAIGGRNKCSVTDMEASRHAVISIQILVNNNDKPRQQVADYG